jgi:hypothetical protein
MRCGLARAPHSSAGAFSSGSNPCANAQGNFSAQALRAVAELRRGLARAPPTALQVLFSFSSNPLRSRAGKLQRASAEGFCRAAAWARKSPPQLCRCFSPLAATPALTRRLPQRESAKELWQSGGVGSQEPPVALQVLFSLSSDPCANAQATSARKR